MRLRRMLAFVLTLALLLGNVTPAYAADTSVVNSISGDVTVTSDENGNLVLTNNSDGTSEVLNLEDETQTLITGEETQTPTTGEETQTPTAGEETQTPTTGEETQTPTTGDESQTPEAGDENQTPGIGNEGQTSDEGEETQTPEGDGTQTPEGEDETLGEEDEVLDEDLEEEVSEEEELDEEEVELVTEEDIKLSNGTISIAWNGGTDEVKYTTVKEALDAAEELAAGEEGVTVNLPMEEGGTFTVTGSDLVVADDYTIALDLHGNTLTLDATEGAIVKSNVNILGGTVKFGAENMTFQILEKVNAPSINNLIINDATKTATLKIGGNSEDNSEALQNACVNFYEVSMSGIRDMVIQDGFYTNSAITADTMRVDLDWIEYQSEEGYTSKQRESTTLNSVDVNELEVNGCVYWSDGSNVSVKESTRLTGGSVLNLAGTFVFHNLVVSGSHSEVYDESVSIKKSFYGTTGEDGVVTYTTNSELTFAESVMIEEGNTLDLNCEMSVDGQWAFDLLPYGHAMADITAETTEGCISADLFQVEGAKLVREGNQLIVREQQEIFRASYWNGNTWTELGKYGDFTTLYDALDDNPDSTYNVELLKNVELSDGEHWNFADLIVNLQLYKDYSSGYTISVAENANASITVDYINSTYINGYELSNWGSGYFNIGDGATLNLRGDKSHQQKDSRSLSMQNLQFMTGNNSKLVCNSQNPDVREMLTMNACYFYNTQTFDIELYGNVNWNPYMRGNNAGQELMQNPVNATPETFAVDFRSLKIENEHPNGAFIGNVITVDNLNVNGNLNCDTLTADNTILKAGSFVCTTDVMTLKNITVTEGENTNCATLATEDIYKAGKLYHTGEIRLQDSLNCGNNTCINFDKSAVNVVIESNNYGSYPEMKRYEEGVQIKNNDVLANLSAPGGEPGQLLENSSYALFREGFKTSVQQDENGDYTVKAIDTTKGIFVMDTTTGKMQSCEDLAEVKGYIFENAEEGSRFEIILNAMTSAKNLDDLDYSSLNDTAEIKLTLNGYELKLMNEQVVAVDVINGFKMNNDARGKLTLAAKNTIKPRSKEAHIWGTDLKSNNTDLTLGNADDMLHSNLYIDNPGSGISLKNLTAYGYVNWMTDTSKTLTIAETLTVHNIHSQEEDVYQSAEFYCKVITKNLDMTEGDLNVADLTVSNELTTQIGRGLMVTPLGEVSLKDIYVNSESKEEMDGDSLRIELHRRVALAEGDDRDNPTFEGASVIDDRGNVTISGAVIADSKIMFPIRFTKNNDYQWGTDEYDNEIWSGRTVNFENGETLAVVKTAPTNKFGIDSNPWDDNACVRKEGTTLKAATRVLQVRHVAGYEWNEEGQFYEAICDIEADYASLEDAIKGIATDFNNAEGEYIFHFVNNENLQKDLTIPACVTTLQLRTWGGGIGEGDDFQYTGEIVRELDLNGHTLNTTATVTMYSGLRVVSNNGIGTLNLNGTWWDALDINEGSTLVNENGEVYQDRLPVLKNVTVNAKNGVVKFWIEDKEQMQNMESTTITAKRVEIKRGKWQCKEVNATEFEIHQSTLLCNKVTATNLLVGAGDYDDGYEKSFLMADDIIINDTGRMEVMGFVGDFDWNGKRPNLTLNGGKLWISSGRNHDEKGNCYLNTLTVSKAFGAESSGEYTVENNGQFFVNTLEMKVGTLYNRGNMIVKNINNIKDFHNEDSLICNTFNQVSGSKNYLAGGSRLMINESGTLYNVNLGLVRGGEGDPVLGLGGEEKQVSVETENGTETKTILEIADVAIKGAFTQNDEKQTLQIAVTDTYLDIENLNGDKTSFNPYTYLDAGAPEEHRVHLFTLEKGATLFTTDHKEFPVESIKVHPFFVLDESGNIVEENGQKIGNINSSTIHYLNTAEKKNEVRVAGEAIELFSLNANGEFNPLKNFTDWQDAMNYLAVVGNVNTSYVLQINDEVLDVGGSLKLPSNIASLEIEGIWSKPTTVVNAGDGKITLNTDISLNKLVLPENTAISTNGKWLRLFEVNGSIQSITGKSADVIVIENSMLELAKPFTGFANMDLVNSNLTVNGDVTVTNVSLVNIEEPVSVTATGKMTFLNIFNTGEGNRLRYGKGLEIKGELISYRFVENEGMVPDTDNAYAVPIRANVTDEEGNVLVDDNDNPITYIAGYRIWDKDEWENVEDKSDYKIVKKNAINLVYTGGEPTENTVLATAPKVPSYWFVYNRSIDEQDRFVQITNVTRKVGNQVLYGPKSAGSDKVILEIDYEQDEQGYEIDKYATLQEAFDEIECIGNSGQKYKIILTDDASTKGDYKFPSKADEVTITSKSGEQYNVYFKSKADIKCNINFADVVLSGTDAKATLAINGFRVCVVRSQLTENIAVTGSGTAKGSEFVVTGDNGIGYVKMASIKDVDTFKVATDVYVSETTTVGNLYLETNDTLCGVGAIKIGNVESYNEGAIATFPTIKKDKNEVVTEFKSTLEITGEVNGILNIKLGKAVDFKCNEADQILSIWDGSEFPESLVEGNKIILAKAPKVATKKEDGSQIVDFIQTTSENQGYLYKKSGNIVYKENAPTVELSYFNGSYNEFEEPIEVVTECETFADAVAEIDNLKTKRDYKICFLPAGESATTELKMPKSGNVNTLTLTSLTDKINDVFYLKELNFTSSVILEDISFVQMVQDKDDNGKAIPGEYSPVTDSVDFPAPVKVKTSSSDLVMAGEVSFNTPILLDGGNKAVLTVTEDAVIKASAEIQGEETYIQGTITKFKNVNINNPFCLDSWQTSVDDYSACTMDVTALTLGEAAEVEVGSSSDNSTVKVKDLTMDGSDLYVSGNAELTNVTLSGGNPIIDVSGQTFKITGLLTSTAYEGKLVTTVNNEGKSVLDISGTAVLGHDKENCIVVQVVDENGESIELAGTKVIKGEDGEEDKEVYFSSPLLKAKKINANVFLVHSECTPEGNTGEYSIKNAEPGYFLKKNGDYVEVHSSDGIVAALCKTDEIPGNEVEEIPVINYYATLNEAIAEIKALNNASQEYTIMLLQDVGTQDAPYKMTVPEKAAKVTFTKPANLDDSIEVFIDTKLTQKTDLAFEDITVTNKNAWDTKNYELAVKSADVTVKGKTTAVNLTLEDEAVLRAEDTTVITNITNVNTVGENNNEIICTKAAGLTIKGYVTDYDENGELANEEENFPRVILDADGEATKVETFGTDIKANNEVVGIQYNLSKTQKIATLEKETMDCFVFQNGGEEVNAVWASKGIYLVEDDYAYATEVVTVNAEDFTEESYTQCLDVAEATNYINTVSNKENGYAIVVKDDISDTKVTDNKVPSELTLPAKDKAKFVRVQTENTNQAIDYAEMSFTGDVKVNGTTAFVALKLNGSTPFSMIMDKGEHELEFYWTEAENFKSITGNKNGISNVSIVGCEAKEESNGLNLSGGITDVANLKLCESDITTKTASKVNNLVITNNATWNAYGATTIGNVALDLNGDNTYITTYYPKDNKGNSTEIPQLTITGNVTGGKLPVKVYDFATDSEITNNYNDAKLVLAKAESADKFVAYDYAQYNEEIREYEFKSDSIQAYKDKSGYVFNGDLESSKVILSQLDETGAWTDSYVKDYAEAIDIINSSGSKTSVYKITLRGDEDTVDVGTLSLPKKDKAQKLVIAGNGEKNNGESVDERTLKYKGTIQPKCDLVFENVILHEVDSDGNGITLKTDAYNVTFGEYVEIVTNDNFETDAALVFKTIDGNKGSVTFEGNSVYVSGEIKLKELAVSGDTEILCEGKVTVTDVVYKNAASEEWVSLALTGEKEIAITNVLSENIDNTLDITTYYKNKAFADSETQLTISGEVDDEVAINIQPMIYDKANSEPHAMTEKEAAMLSVNADTSPKKFQKVINGTKMMVSEEVKVWYLNDDSDWTSGGDPEDVSDDLRAIKYEGGIYFTNEESGIEVVGKQVVEKDVNGNLLQEPEEIPRYQAEFFTWEQAVKEIDKLNHTDWKYEIIVLKDQGCGTPLKSVTMPSKAKEVVIIGVDKTFNNGDVDQIGILTTSNKIALKCPTEFNNISLCAVKKNGGYYRTPLTLDSGKFALTLNSMNRGCEYDNMGWFEGNINVTGQAAGLVEVIGNEEDYSDMISQISKVGTVVMGPAIDESYNHIQCHYEISDGIKDVKNLVILPGVAVDTVKSEVSVTDLTIGRAIGELEENGDEDKPQISNELHSSLRAKNITVSDTAIMASSNLKAGTTTVGDGKITLNNVIFRDTHNHIEGKQDKNGKSLISIKGDVTFDKDYPNPQHWGGATISLCLSNSVQNYAKLANGMTLLTAPKAPSSMFNTHCEWRGMDEEGNEVYEPNMGPAIDGFGLYKAGNDIKYGNLTQNEVRLYIGTSNVEGEGGKFPTMEFATFEEAVKAIDTLARYKQDVTKVFEEYTIELLKDVMIGNDKGDGKYTALTLPSKTSQFTIQGCGHSLKFSGKVTLKCHTTLRDIQMVSMKTVKGEAIPSALDIAIGNYTLTNRYVSYGYEESGDTPDSEPIWNNILNNITGSAKGCLVISEDSYVEANNISGISVVFMGNGEEVPYNKDESGEITGIQMGCIWVKENFNIKELKFADYAAGVVQVDGKFTADVVCTEGENVARIAAWDKNPLQIKGMTKEVEGYKVSDSVFMLQKDGKVTEEIQFWIIPSTEQATSSGTKALTGKYLSPDDWSVSTFVGEDRIERELYLNGADLYVGNIVAQG